VEGLWPIERVLRAEKDNLNRKGFFSSNDWYNKAEPRPIRPLVKGVKSMADELRKVIMAGVGAVAHAVEKTAEAIGEVTP
jgi:hypothetical protein